MGPFYQQLSNILTTPPGSLAYHLVIIFSIVWALQAALSRWGGDQQARVKRMLLGFGLLLIARLVLFLVAGIAGQGLGSAEILLPPADRAVSSTSLIIIIWLWAFPKPPRLLDIASIFLLGIVFIMGIISLVWWGGQDQAKGFNGTLLGSLWEMFAIVLTFCGGLILITRQPDNWGIGLGMLGLNLLGHLVSLIFPLTNSDFPAAVRLAQMAAYPLLYILTQGFPSPTIPDQRAPAPEKISIPPGQKFEFEPTPPRYSKGFLQDWLKLESTPDPARIYQTIARFLSQGMNADVCILISPVEKDGNMPILVSYNLSKDHVQGNIPFNARQIPIISNAIQRLRPIRLPVENNSQDLANLKQALAFQENGHILAAPVISVANQLLLGMILLRLKTAWTSEEQNQLTALGQIMAQMLQRSRQYADLQADFQKKLETAQSGQGEAQSAQAQSDASLLEIQEETQTLLVHLKEENQQLKEALTKSSPEAGSRILAFDKLEKELRSSLVEVKSRSQEKSQEMQQLKEELGLALSELDHLRTQLTQTEQQVNEVKAQSTKQLTSEQIAEIASTVKELRHPISTIVDYVDLLLDESVGALGALQHKFLDRIKVSVDQLGELINQLVQSTLLDSAKIRITSRVIDLNAIIEAALAATRPQIQEKNINLHVDVPITYPTIRADGDALQQVLTNILRNAEVSTLADGIISLQVRIEEKDDQKHLLFQVTDSGEGISSEDLPQVFSRPYRADNAPIRGIDGPGMELSITKTLVEALKGHIWVDSEVGHGSTFSFLIPLVAEVGLSRSSASPNIKSSGVVKK